MAELPFLSLDVRALVGDTSHMSPNEYAGYTKILWAIWLHGGSIPDDPVGLRRITGLSARQWERARTVICRPLTFADGKVSQKRMTDTLLRTREIRQKRAEAAAKRWENRLNLASKENPTVMPFSRPKPRGTKGIW